MELRQINEVSIEIKIGERVYKFNCSPDSPLGEIHDALSSMRSHVIQLMKDQDKSSESNKCSGE